MVVQKERITVGTNLHPVWVTQNTSVKQKLWNHPEGCKQRNTLATVLSVVIQAEEPSSFYQFLTLPEGQTRCDIRLPGVELLTSFSVSKSRYKGPILDCGYRKGRRHSLTFSSYAFRQVVISCRFKSHLPCNINKTLPSLPNLWLAVQGFCWVCNQSVDVTDQSELS